MADDPTFLKAILAAPEVGALRLQGARSLDLSGNEIGKKGRDALTRRFGTRVDLGDSRLDLM